MKLNHLIAIITVVLVFIADQVESQMSSTNYRITTTVMSGGGGPWPQPASR